MANITVSSVKWPKEMPPDDAREPETLYVIPEGIPERDQCLGRFMGVWSGLEQTLQTIVHMLMGGPYSTAGVVFTNCGAIAPLCDLMNGLGELVLTSHEQRQLTGLIDRLRKHNTKRNRLVHGAWIPEVVIGGDDQGRPIVKAFVWTRVYSPTSPIQKQQINDVKNQAMRSKYRFTPDDINKVALDVGILRDAFNVFQLSTGLRLRPEGPNMK